MNKYWNITLGVVLLISLTTSAQAFSSKDEQIDHYLSLMSKSNTPAKIQMLERLQWSGLSDPRFFDVIEANVVAQSQSNELTKNEFKLLGYQVRALGYSGNTKYQDTLKQVKKDALERKIRGYAKRALADMRNFSVWNSQISESNFKAEGKPAEIEAYMKMLSIDDPSVQKLAARAIYHEQQSDPDLLQMTANVLEGIYLKEGLDKEAQDTAAWLCKALGNSGDESYVDLLVKVVEQTPYRKIKKYAAKYTP